MALRMISLSVCGVVSQLLWCRNISKTKKKKTSIKVWFKFSCFFCDVPQQLLEELAGNAVQISILPMVRAPMTLVFPWLFIRWPQKVSLMRWKISTFTFGIYLWFPDDESSLLLAVSSGFWFRVRCEDYWVHCSSWNLVQNIIFPLRMSCNDFVDPLKIPSRHGLNSDQGEHRNFPLQQMNVCTLKVRHPNQGPISQTRCFSGGQL